MEGGAGVEIWRLPDVLGGIDVLRADVRRAHFPKHFHDDYTFGLVTRGANRFIYRGERVTAVAGAVCLADPGEVHTGEADEGGWSYWTVHVQPDALARLRAELDETADTPPEFLAGVIEDATAVRAFAGFFRTVRTAEPLEQETRALSAVGRLISRYSACPPRREGRCSDTRLACAVRDLLAERLSESMTLAELEHSTGAGRYRLIRAFRRAYGLPPHAWRAQKRLAAARLAILEGKPIAQAAFEAGFADQAHLTRSFRRFLGYTPGLLARAQVRACDLG